MACYAYHASFCLWFSFLFLVFNSRRYVINVTLCYVTLRYVTLRYVRLCYVTLQLSLIIILKYCFSVCVRYEQYVEDAYVAFLKQKGQAEQVSKIISSLVKCEFK